MASAAWYTYPFDNPAGQREPFGGGPKPDSNVQCPDGTPVTAILPGTVSGIEGGEVAWGAAVTIKLDTPVNSIATHMAFLHLQPLPAAIKVGTRVNVGTVVGFSGGKRSAGSQKGAAGRRAL